MTYSYPSLTVGIEEEYFLVDRASRELATDPPADMFSECSARLQEMIKPEFLKSQIEVSTPVCQSLGQAREALALLRSTVAEVGEKFGLAPIAASTHPFSEWQDQQHTNIRRYNVLAQDMQAVVRRLQIAGMHVHVGVEDDELRIDLMNQATYFLPHLLALSTSSPFWRGEDTGLKCYRLSVFEEMPRTGLPQRFESYEEYLRHVNVMVRAGLIEDATMLWWYIRPSARFATLEMRITDVCTRLDDAIGVAALFVCTVRMLNRLREQNQRWRIYADLLIKENLWRAQRYGLDEGLVDFGKGEIVPCEDLMDEILQLVREDAAALGCEAEVSHLLNVVKDGTSAHRQLAVFAEALANGANEKDALKAVVDMLIDETVMGL